MNAVYGRRTLSGRSFGKHDVQLRIAEHEVIALVDQGDIDGAAQPLRKRGGQLQTAKTGTENHDAHGCTSQNGRNSARDSESNWRSEMECPDPVCAFYPQISRPGKHEATWQARLSPITLGGMSDSTPSSAPATPARRYRPSLRQVLWLLGFSIFVAFLVWMTLDQIRDIAIENKTDPAEHAACVAGFDPASGQSVEEACPEHNKVIFAARNPIRNAIIIFVLLLGGGYIYLIYHYSNWGPSFGSAIPPRST